MRKLIAFLALILAPSLVFAQPAMNPEFANMIAGETVSAAVAAVSTDVPLLIKYIGTDPLAKVAVAAGGDITFTSGSDGDQVDTSLECPVSGALGGIIDVSDPACDTLGEVVDIINASSSWRAVILDGLRSDSSDNTLITLSASAAVMSPEGLGLLNDGTVSHTMTRALTTKRTINAYLGADNSLLVNPFQGERTVVFQFSSTFTGTGADTMYFYSAAENYRAGLETATTVWSEAGGGSTTKKTINMTPFGLFCKKDEKCLVRHGSATTFTAVTANAYGSEYVIQR